MSVFIRHLQPGQVFYRGGNVFVVLQGRGGVCAYTGKPTSFPILSTTTGKLASFPKTATCTPRRADEVSELMQAALKTRWESLVAGGRAEGKREAEREFEQQRLEASERT
jgi:hypothetical protein